MRVTLETDRLILRSWTIDDFEDWAAMTADQAVMRYLTVDGKPMSRFASWQSFCGHVGHWVLRGFGQFAVIERATNEFVGRVGPWQPEGWPDFEIGWVVRSTYWGKGYATEAARKCMDYAFTALGRIHVVSLISPENTQSIRVAERLGERLEATIRLPHMPDRDILQYGLSREQWHGSGR